MLSAIVFFPLLGAAVIALLPGSRPALCKWVATIFAAIALGLSIVLYLGFNSSVPGLQFVEKVNWIALPTAGVSYFLGVDGLNLPMVVLTTLLSLMAVLGSWRIDTRPKAYFTLLLLLETGVVGVFASMDFLLFFLFWEVELIPMYLLIGIWGGPRREYAAIKFVIYTLAGSALMLVGILALYFNASPHTFDMTFLAHQKYELSFAIVAFAFLFAGFAVKLPVVPFHTWLPDAHVQAPTAVSVLLAGVSAEDGRLRDAPSAGRDAARGDSLLVVAPRITRGRQRAVRGVYLDGPEGPEVDGGLLVGEPHGLRPDRRRRVHADQPERRGDPAVHPRLHHRPPLPARRQPLRQGPHPDDSRVWWLARRMPVLASIFVMAGLASLGLPGMSGFVAEFTVFIGSYATTPAYTILSAVAIVITAGYILWMIRRVFYGPFNERWEHLTDARGVELVPLVGLLAVIFLIGLFPSILTDVINHGVAPLVARGAASATDLAAVSGLGRLP